MIIFVLLFIILIFMTFKETFFYNQNYTDVLTGAVQRSSLERDAVNRVLTFKPNLIFIYCSGCKSANSKILTEFFNSFGSNIENIQITKIDISRNNDPLNIIRGFIHPKYLKKESFYNAPTTTPNTQSNYNYNIDPKLKDYFHDHNDPIYGRQSDHVCEGPDLYTNVQNSITTRLNSFII